ncbi:unnamed protein product [Caretta caretta]
MNPELKAPVTLLFNFITQDSWIICTLVRSSYQDFMLLIFLSASSLFVPPLPKITRKLQIFLANAHMVRR